MTRRVRVEVTEQDIANGDPGSRCACPIALAILRATGITAGVTWTTHPIQAVWFDMNDTEQTWPLPLSCFTFAHNFDVVDRHAVAPFAFDLEVP